MHVRLLLRHHASPELLQGISVLQGNINGVLFFLFGFLHILETHSESESLVLCVVHTSTPRISEIPVEHLQHL
jgi:hypothetical protein